MEKDIYNTVFMTQDLDFITFSLKIPVGMEKYNDLIFYREDLNISFSSAGTKVNVFYSTGDNFLVYFSSGKGGPTKSARRGWFI